MYKISQWGTSDGHPPIAIPFALARLVTLGAWVCLISVPVKIAFAAEGLESAGDFHDRTVELLRKHQFTRNPRCADFSNLILERAGLPDLGRDSPVEGIRGDMNRQGQGLSSPVFDDAIQAEGQPNGKKEYRVKAYVYPTIKRAWYLDLTRRQANAQGRWLELRSRFTFRIGTVNNHPVCDLVRIDFASPSKGLAGKYDAKRCMDLFDPMGPAPEGDEVSRLALEQDCATGLRFFDSVKYPR